METKNLDFPAKEEMEWNERMSEASDEFIKANNYGEDSSETLSIELGEFYALMHSAFRTGALWAVDNKYPTKQ